MINLLYHSERPQAVCCIFPVLLHKVCSSIDYISSYSLFIYVRNRDLWRISTIEIKDMISGYLWINCPCFMKSTSSLDSVSYNFGFNTSQNLLSIKLQHCVHHIDDNSVTFQF